jgi:hypothetical protein
MSDLPKYIGKEFRPFDWYGWLMSIIGLVLIAIWSRDNTIGWFEKIVMVGTISFFTIEYFFRVCYGRVYKMVYYDTILCNVYEIDVDGVSYYVAAENEKELQLYIDAYYPTVGQNYVITNDFPVESFVKREHYE